MIFDLIRDIFDLPPNNRIYKRDIATLTHHLREEPTELIPWSDEETELLSLNEVKLKLKGLKHSGAGVITTIFHESLVKFAIKDYRRKKDYGLAVIITSDREYVYLQLPTVVKIYVNGRPLGIVNQQAQLYITDPNKIEAHIERTTSGYNTVRIGDVAVGQVVNPDGETSKNPRVIVPLVDLSGHELDAFIGLCFFQWLTKIKKF